MTKAVAAPASARSRHSVSLAIETFVSCFALALKSGRQIEPQELGARVRDGGFAALAP
jgi:hypothetical protein